MLIRVFHLKQNKGFQHLCNIIDKINYLEAKTRIIKKSYIIKRELEKEYSSNKISCNYYDVNVNRNRKRIPSSHRKENLIGP